MSSAKFRLPGSALLSDDIMTELAWKSNKIETLDDIISIVGSDWIWLETYGQCLVDNIKTWIENSREKHAMKVAAEQARKDAQKAAEKAAVMEATRKAAEAARKRRTTEAIVEGVCTPMADRKRFSRQGRPARS